MFSFITASLLAISLNSPEAIKDYITARAQAYHYPIVKALAIAECESQFDPNAKSKTSSAGGVFQFIDGTWRGVMRQMGLPEDSNKNDPHFNIEAGLFLLDKEGDHHWEASKKCWQPKYQKYLADSDLVD